MWGVIWIGLFEVFVDDVGFIEGFCALVVGEGCGDGGDEALWIQSEKGGGFVVWVYFDVLVRDLFLFKSDPCALD